MIEQLLAINTFKRIKLLNRPSIWCAIVVIRRAIEMAYFVNHSGNLVSEGCVVMDRNRRFLRIRFPAPEIGAGRILFGVITFQIQTERFPRC